MAKKAQSTFSVLFVCTGNTCRSPMAEGLLKAAIAGERLIQVRSAGVAAMPGARMSHETRSVLSQCDASIKKFKSRQVDETVVNAADMIIAMTQTHAEIIMAHFPDASERVRLLTDFLPADDELYGQDVPDPIGMGARAYEEVAEVITLAIPGILEKISQHTDEN